MYMKISVPVVYKCFLRNNASRQQMHCKPVSAKNIEHNRIIICFLCLEILTVTICCLLFIFSFAINQDTTFI